VPESCRNHGQRGDSRKKILGTQLAQLAHGEMPLALLNPINPLRGCAVAPTNFKQEDALEYAQDLAETKDGSIVKVFDEKGEELGGG
jgi:hypothetical protein